MNANEQPTWQERYYYRFYRSRLSYRTIDDEFRVFCKQVVREGSKILEVGAGPSNDTSRALATIGEVHGLDPDPEVLTNDALTSGSLLKGDRFPFPDESFDCAVSDYVIEHIKDPSQHLGEIARILKPNGIYVFRTPNKFHYVATIAALTPHVFHLMVANWARRRPKDAHDPYPTVYAMNTRRAITRNAREAGLIVDALRLVEREPVYARFSRIAFGIFLLYERLVNATERLDFLRANFFVVLKKPRSDPFAE